MAYTEVICAGADSLCCRPLGTEASTSNDSVFFVNLAMFADSSPSRHTRPALTEILEP